MSSLKTFSSQYPVRARTNLTAIYWYGMPMILRRSCDKAISALRENLTLILVGVNADTSPRLSIPRVAVCNGSTHPFLHAQTYLTLHHYFSGTRLRQPD